ncbi:hypothetical protein BD410DRAFT_804516 [Rickenella mellea]|uniref:Uncharacterized protein n=1 Tax=Rickenella mellea TaxID=50990 RepID=A0A4Y7Q2J8_9AGAM|nr:hypothetical protein BD410DRAFT_804516 [Rickenella mellea]
MREQLLNVTYQFPTYKSRAGTPNSSGRKELLCGYAPIECRLVPDEIQRISNFAGLAIVRMFQREAIKTPVSCVPIVMRTELLDFPAIERKIKEEESSHTHWFTLHRKTNPPTKSNLRNKERPTTFLSIQTGIVTTRRQFGSTRTSQAPPGVFLVKTLPNALSVGVKMDVDVAGGGTGGVGRVLSLVNVTAVGAASRLRVLLSFLGPFKFFVEQFQYQFQLPACVGSAEPLGRRCLGRHCTVRMSWANTVNRAQSTSPATVARDESEQDRRSDPEQNRA